jgi:hypothetical protein
MSFYTYVPDAEATTTLAIRWRNAELLATDYIVPTTDHPQHSDYMAYRVLLRDWPSTEDFTVTRPVVPTGE